MEAVERFVIHCHVGYDDDITPSPGHQAEFHGLGYEYGEQQAHEAGWIDTGNRWCCPACANDKTPITTYTIHDEFIGDCVYTDLESAEDTLLDWRDGLDPDEATQVVLIEEMSTRGVVNRLPAFEP